MDISFVLQPDQQQTQGTNDTSGATTQHVAEPVTPVVSAQAIIPVIYFSGHIYAYPTCSDPT